MGDVHRGPICLRMGMARGISFLANKTTMSINELQEENARLKDLVVTLSSFVPKKIVPESKSGVHDIDLISSG
jgi:hypothetical protein